MEIYLIIMLVLMILGSIYSLHAKDLLSAVVSYGIVGFGLVIAFLLLYAPDLAIVQVVVEIITLIIMIAVITNATHEEQAKEFSFSSIFYIAVFLFFGFVLLGVLAQISGLLNSFGHHVTRMASAYIINAQEAGSANIVTGILFHFRAYDTLGEATVLFTAVIGILTVLRHHGKKKEDKNEG
jgi:multisubunit Na+/H+ antiporter MnhB subunit